MAFGCDVVEAVAAVMVAAAWDVHEQVGQDFQISEIITQ